MYAGALSASARNHCRNGLPSRISKIGEVWSVAAVRLDARLLGGVPGVSEAACRDRTDCR